MVAGPKLLEASQQQKSKSEIVVTDARKGRVRILIPSCPSSHPLEGLARVVLPEPPHHPPKKRVGHGHQGLLVALPPREEVMVEKLPSQKGRSLPE